MASNIAMKAQRNCLLSLGILAGIFFCVLVVKIQTGTLWYHDELLTANRVREMLVRHNPWFVTLNFVPDFHKPPLQYWFSALVLHYLPNYPEFAIRVGSTLYGAGCVVAVGWLALCALGVDDKHRTRVAIWSALALMACGFFVRSARMGLLDCGVALHLTLAVAACQLARRDPRWWWFVGLQAVLGTWQKMPFAFGAWVLILMVRAIWDRASLKSAHLIGSLVAAILCSSGWFLMQWWQFGAEPLHGILHAQTNDLISRHHPDGTGFRPDVYWFWLARGWGIIGVLLPIWLVIDFVRSKKREGIFEVTLICFLYLLGFALLPYRSEHYLVAITPLLAFVAAAGFNRLLPSNVVFAGAILTCLPVAAFHYFSAAHAQQKLWDASQRLGTNLLTDEQIIIDPLETLDFDVKNFAMFYANTKVSVISPKIPQLAASVAYRGLMRKENFALFNQSLPRPAKVLYANEEWVCWQLPKDG